MFVFEGNGVVINLNAVARNQARYPNILRLAVLAVISWFVLLAMVCYFTYREDSGEYITFNLQITGFTIFINALFNVNAISSYPIQILCAFEIIEELSFFQNEKDSKLVHMFKLYSERILVVVAVTVAAVVIPRFYDFLNISGSVGASALGFVLPPLYYMKTFGIKNLPKHIVAFNIFLILFGIGGGIYSVYTSIKSIIDS